MRVCVCVCVRVFRQRCRRVGLCGVVATRRASSATVETRRPASVRRRRRASTPSSSGSAPTTGRRTPAGARCVSTSAPPTGSSAYYTEVPAVTALDPRTYMAYIRYSLDFLRSSDRPAYGHVYNWRRSASQSTASNASAVLIGRKKSRKYLI